MATNKTKRTKQERFERYLEKHRVSSAILRAIVCLYENNNKPNDPIRYLCEHLGYGIPEADEVHELQQKVKELRTVYYNLLDENEDLMLLAEPPVKVDEFALDDETKELIQREEAELEKIKKRQACILKAYEETKVKVVPPIKVKKCPSLTDVSVQSVGDKEKKESSVSQGKDDVEVIIDEEGEHDGPGSSLTTQENLICSPDIFSDDEVESELRKEENGSGYNMTTTIIIPLDELKNHQRHTCGL